MGSEEKTSEDFFDDGGASAPPEILSRIRSAALEAKDLEDAIASMEDFLKGKKAQLNAIKMKTLPDLMASAQLSTFSLEDGFTITVDDYVSGTISKAPGGLDDGLEYLDSIGGGGIIKASIEMSFSKDQLEQASELFDQFNGIMKDLSIPAQTTFGKAVHPQSLKGFVNEKLKGGESFDYERLGMFVGRVAKTKRPKPKA